VVSHWLKRAKERGGATLSLRSRPGATPELTAEERVQFPAPLAQGAEALGFVGEVWTTKLVAAIIQRELGLRYDPVHVSLLRSLGSSPQRPNRRAPNDMKRRSRDGKRSANRRL
jgi:transposase